MKGGAYLAAAAVLLGLACAPLLAVAVLSAVLSGAAGAGATAAGLTAELAPASAQVPSAGAQSAFWQGVLATLHVPATTANVNKLLGSQLNSAIATGVVLAVPGSGQPASASADFAFWQSVLKTLGVADTTANVDKLTAWQQDTAAGYAVELAVSALKVPTGVQPANASESAFWAAVLKALGVPATVNETADINSLTAWALHESAWNDYPPDGAEYTHNPLNSTLTNFCHDGIAAPNDGNPVWVYCTAADGVGATAETLESSYYPDILSALKSGAGLCGTGFSSEFLEWSDRGYSQVC